MNGSRRPQVALLIFAKSPIAGSVKTRMQPNLSEADCLLLHKALVRLTLAKFKNLDSSKVDKTLLLTGPLDRAYRYAAEFGVADEFFIDVQFGKDLGERLTNALENKFNSGYLKVIIIGTDSPLLRIEQIESSIDALSEHEVVIGPSADGGYYLIGFSANIPAVLRGISWGESSVYEQTLKRIRLHGLSWKKLETGFDVDTMEDLRELYRHLQGHASLVTDDPNTQLYELVESLVNRKRMP
jgi:rSAM/selenodomain-associated transferase 1